MIKTQQNPYTNDYEKKLNVGFTILGLILSAYLIWPCFTAVHVEGFSAQIESIALLKSAYPSLAHDPYLPLITQFIFETRSAVVDLLSWVYEFFPKSGDVAFRILICVSFAILLCSSVIFAKRLGNIPTFFTLFALILTQGIPETSFFFNDNIVSAVLAITALTLISNKPTLLTLVLSGLILGIALLARLDAVFIMPIIVGTLCLRFNSLIKGGIAFFVVCMSILTVLLIQYHLQGFSLLDAFMVGKKFASIMHPISWNEWVVVRILFFGPISLVLFIFGTALYFQHIQIQKNYLEFLTYFIYPVLLIAFAPKVTQVRYIFPLLSPLIALYVGIGLQWVYRQVVFGEGQTAKIAKIGAVIAIIIFIFPPIALRIMDGPRALVGRVWSPIQWWRWQDVVNLSLARTQKVVDTFDNHNTNILISTHWNDEFYARYKLIEAGFKPQLASSLYPGCNGFSLFTKSDSVVVHIRTQAQYSILHLDEEGNAALQISTTLKCNAVQPIKVYLSAVGQDIHRVSAEIYGFTDAAFPGSLNEHFFDALSIINKKNKVEELVSYKELSTSEVARIQAMTAQYLLKHPLFDKMTGEHIDIDLYAQYYRPLDNFTNKLLQN